MERLYISQAPEEVQKAFAEVRAKYPNLHRVTFDEDCRWCYADVLDKPFNFEGLDIPQDVLEDAADAQYNIGVPAMYTAFTEKELSKSEIPGKPTVTLTQIDVTTFDVNCGVACVSFEELKAALMEFAFQVKHYQADSL